MGENFEAQQTLQLDVFDFVCPCLMITTDGAQVGSQMGAKSLEIKKWCFPPKKWNNFTQTSSSREAKISKKKFRLRGLKKGWVGGVFFYKQQHRSCGRV